MLLQRSSRREKKVKQVQSRGRGDTILSHKKHKLCIVRGTYTRTSLKDRGGYVGGKREEIGSGSRISRQEGR